MSEVKVLPNLVWKYNYEPGFDIEQFLDYQSKEAELHQTEADGGKSTAGHPNPPHEWDCNKDFIPPTKFNHYTTHLGCPPFAQKP